MPGIDPFTTQSGDPSRPILVDGGVLLTQDPAIPDGPGAVLIVDGVIVSAGPAAASHPAAHRAEVIDASDGIVLPGLIDTHRHTWQSAVRHIGTDWDLDDYFGHVFFRLAPQYRPEDVYAGTLLGAFGALDAGVTTLVDWSHIQNTPEHTDAAVAALQAAGLRAVFAYGWPQDDPARWVGGSDTDLPVDIERVRGKVLADDDALVTMALAARGPELASMDVTRRDLALARRLDLAVTMHVGAGDFGPEHRAVEQLQRDGLLDERLTLVHACTTSDDELRMAAAAGAHASVSPLIEMTMPGLGASATGRLLAAGIRPGLSTDSEMATSGDLFTQMRAALAEHRLLNRQPDSVALGVADVLRMATIDGAATAGLGDRTGSLTPGKRADLIVVAAGTPALHPVIDPVAAVVMGAHPGLVRTVVVDGRVVKLDGRLCGPVSAAMAGATRSLEHLVSHAPDLLSGRASGSRLRFQGVPWR